MRRSILVVAVLVIAALAYAQTTTAPQAKPADIDPFALKAPPNTSPVKWEYSSRVLFNYTPDEMPRVRGGQRDHVSQAPVVLAEEDRRGWELVSTYTLKGIYPINPTNPEHSVERIVYIFRKPAPAKK